MRSYSNLIEQKYIFLLGNFDEELVENFGKLPRAYQKNLFDGPSYPRAYLFFN